VASAKRYRRPAGPRRPPPAPPGQPGQRPPGANPVHSPTLARRRAWPAGRRRGRGATQPTEAGAGGACSLCPLVAAKGRPYRPGARGAPSGRLKGLVGRWSARTSWTRGPQRGGHGPWPAATGPFADIPLARPLTFSLRSTGLERVVLSHAIWSTSRLNWTNPLDQSTRVSHSLWSARRCGPLRRHALSHLIWSAPPLVSLDAAIWTYGAVVTTNADTRGRLLTYASRPQSN
jgi:hypothetical protein